MGPQSDHHNMVIGLCQTSGHSDQNTPNKKKDIEKEDERGLHT